MKVEVLAIGNELLDGRVTDTNGATLARELRKRGMALSRVTVVSDELQEIVEELGAAASRADLVVCSGGLGPTDDDRTRHAAAAWLGVELEFHEESWEAIVARFASIGFEVTPNNRLQALFPKGATVWPNEVGTAPAFECRDGAGKRAVFLPGVPSEYRWLLERYLLPTLGAEGGRRLVSRSWKFFGRGESALEHDLQDIAFPAGLIVGYRAHFPEVHVTLSAWDDGDGAQERMVEQVGQQVLGRLGRFLVAEGAESLPERLGRLLGERGQRVTTVESCTGGMIAAMLTAVPGSSGWFDQGMVTYANEAKVRLAGVSPETLGSFGAVSRQTAVEMARGGRAAAGATYGVAVSGIAGPSGGTPEKPVGTVEVAVDTPEGTYARRLALRASWGREKIRQAAAHHALSMLLRVLEGRVGDDPGAEGPL
jgi:nicotinamide-nucleotide amidase